MCPREMQFVDGTTQMEVPAVNKSVLLWRVRYRVRGNKKWRDWDHLAGSDAQALGYCMQVNPNMEFETATVKLWRRVI